MVARRRESKVVAVARTDPGSPNWEQLAAEIQSLASDLDAFSSALRDLKLGDTPSDTSMLPHLTPSDRPSPWAEPWFGTPIDPKLQLTSVDLRLAQVRRSLRIVGAFVRTARERGDPLSPVPPDSPLAFGLVPDAGSATPTLLVPAPTVAARSTPRRRKKAKRAARRAPSSAPASAAPSGAAVSGGGSSRTIGGPVRPDLTAFLTINRTERFDIEVLNALPLATILEEAHGDRSLFNAAATQAAELMARVKHEVDDPGAAGAFLREQVRRWHDESGRDAHWTVRMPDRWTGLFADSRTHGGRLRPWLNRRLWSLREQAMDAGTLRQKLARRLKGDEFTDEVVLRDAPEQIRAEVAQAILDDLAAHPRDPTTPLPLICLSELAIRRQVVTVNEALGQLFSVPDSGPFIILHPNRYPNCEEVVLRPPLPKARGAALAYTLGPGRPAPRPLPVRDRAAEGPSSMATPGTTPDTLSEAPVEMDLDSEAVWEADSVSHGAWRQVVNSVRADKGRLASPPADFRGRAAYPVLVDLLLDDREFRRGFLATKWRGRPAGPPLLASLLDAGSLTPEVSTDHEYLEAELGELARAGIANPTGDALWTVKGWSISREGSHKEGFRFRAQKSG